MATSCILYPAAAVRPPAISTLHPSGPPAISFLRLPSRRAHLRAVVLSRPAASPVLRCSGESACVAAQDEENVVPPPSPSPWPSKEEWEKFTRLDFSSAAVRERFRLESVEARAAVVGAVADVFRPLWENFTDLRNLKYVHDTEEFHIGMPFGALMTCIGMYHLWKLAPNLCLDVAMPYAFYKLSVLAADVRRRGFSPDLIIRIKFAIALAMIIKDHPSKFTPLDCYIRYPVYFIYYLSVGWDLVGKKKMAKYALPAILVQLFQNLKLMKVPKKSSGSGAKGEPEKPSGEREVGQTLQLVCETNDSNTAQQESELVQCVHEPETPSGEKEGGQILQLVSEPNDSSSAKQDGEAPQSVSAPNNHLNITVQQEGEPLQSFCSEPENL